MADAAPEKRRASKNADSGGFSTSSNLALPNSVVQVVAQKVASSRPSVNAKTFDIWFLNCENENTRALQAEGPPVRRASFDFCLVLVYFLSNAPGEKWRWVRDERPLLDASRRGPGRPYAFGISLRRTL
jgi:hypothetical protein